MDNLITYLNLMKSKLEPFENTVNTDIVMEELTSIATNNWIKNGVPNLSKEQFDIVLRRSLVRTIILN
jgi:hypothetical protein